MLPLAQALRDDLGHEVRWAVCEEYRPYLEARGFVVHPCGLGEGRWAKLKEVPGGERLVGPATPAFFGALFGTVLTPPMLSDLTAVTRAWPPDIFVHDRNELAAAVLAASMGRRHVSSNFGADPPEANINAAAAAVEHLWEGAGLAMPPWGGLYQYAFIDMYPEALSPKAPLPCRRLVIRPADRAATPPPVGWVPDGRTTVYLTMGTIFNDIAVTQLALDAVSKLDIRVVATTGRQMGGAVHPGPNTQVFDYVSQESILPHVSAVLSHAGSGTFLGALAHGLPMVCLPQGADQFMNARLGARAGVATNIEPGDATVESVRDAVAAALTDDSMRARAGEVAAQIAAMPGAREVAEEVVALAG